MLEIEADGPLAPVGGLEAHVHTLVQLVQAGGDQAAVGVPGLGVLDLDDLGAPLGEDGPRHRDEDVGGHLDHPHA